jgi:hypothetical protein
MSRWGDLQGKNLHGVLHQQGKVLLDRDWNDQIRILNKWQDRLGLDAIGRDVAAIPAVDPFALLATEARVDGQKVWVRIQPGTGWVDGVPWSLPGERPSARNATYFEPPLQEPAVDAASIAAGVRDALILETWREELSAFQVPEELLEPALGGPDTTLRIQSAGRFRLLRLAGEEECEDIVERLRDDPTTLGKLKVSLQKEETPDPDEDCPVVEGGGYTGFEHFLYRIEMAKVDAGSPVMFKWSQFNGGLVGRGKFDSGNGGQKKVQITGNVQAITTSGMDEYYLEVVEYDEELGNWRVTYGAEATLDEYDLLLGTEHYVELELPSGDVFFRLWSGILPISGFSEAVGTGEPTSLRDGIRLEFESGAGVQYRPGDYWTFAVRAGEIENPEVLVDPLTDLPHCGCCVPVRPEDDLHEIVEEVLETGGGCVCLMPGDHRLTKPLDLTRVTDLRFEGFGLASRLHISGRLRGNAPFRLRNTNRVSFRSFSVLHHGQSPVWECSSVQGLEIEDLFVFAGPRAADPIVSVLGGGSNGWRLEDNLFIGSVGIEGSSLHRSELLGNVFLGDRWAIRLGSAMDLAVERNEMAGITNASMAPINRRFAEVARRAVPRSAAAAMIARIPSPIRRRFAAGMLSGSAARRAPADPRGLVGRPTTRERELTPSREILASALRNIFGMLISPSSEIISNRYVGLEVSGAFNLSFSENRILGGMGLDAEILESRR